VLQYARALGVDPDEIAGELKQLNQFDDVPVTPEPAIQPMREDRLGFGFPLRGDLSGVNGSTLGSLIAAVGVILACALIYSWWQTPREMRKVDTAMSVKPPSAASAQQSEQPAPAPPQIREQASADQPPPAQAAASPPDAAAVRVGLSAEE